MQTPTSELKCFILQADVEILKNNKGSDHNQPNTDAHKLD